MTASRKPGKSKQRAADRRAASAGYRRFRRDYLDRWRAMLAAWRRPPRPRMLWMMYASNYLFATNGVRWALDPLRPNHLLRDLPRAVPVRLLRGLDFILLTHGHGDHFDLPLLNTLRGSNVRLVVPEHLLDAVNRHARPSKSQVLPVRPGQPLTIKGVRIEPFASWHWEVRPDGRRSGPDATGYLVESAGRRWLFPGDVRTYSPAALRRFAPIDCLFAHLWLGRGRAHLAKPPLLKEFCDFMLACRPRRVVIAHLNEYSRRDMGMWNRRHLELVRALWRQRGPGIPLLAPAVGRGVAL